MTEYHGVRQGTLWVPVYIHVQDFLHLQDTLLNDGALSGRCPSPVCLAQGFNAAMLHSSSQAHRLTRHALAGL
jgi:hypothetical protein